MTSPGFRRSTAGGSRGGVIITFINMDLPASHSLVPRSVVRTGALARAGGAAQFTSDEFFSARVRNPHTRRA